MSERDDDHFDLDEEFLDGAAEEDHDYDRIIDRVDRGTKPKAGVKKGRLPGANSRTSWRSAA